MLASPPGFVRYPFARSTQGRRQACNDDLGLTRKKLDRSSYGPRGERNLAREVAGWRPILYHPNARSVYAYRQETTDASPDDLPVDAFARSLKQNHASIGSTKYASLEYVCSLSDNLTIKLSS